MYKLDGVIQSLIVDDILERNIETTDFCPTTDTELDDGTQFHISLQNEMMANGFYIKPDTDGDLFVITRRAYVRNKNSFDGLIPVNLNGKAGVWEPVLVVYVYSQTGGSTTTDSEGTTWNSAAANITIGISR